jgi:hypothetical protein
VSTSIPAPSPPADPRSSSGTDATTTRLSRAIDLTSRLATSWVGIVTAYAGAVTAAVFAFQKLNEPLRGTSIWIRAALVSAVPFAVLVFHTIPVLIEQRRRKRLTEITGQLQSGYFRLAPRAEEALFTRADGKHQEILEWLLKSVEPVLYLTGQSGSGKSSLLTAWVLPELERQNRLVIRLRGYQDPAAALEQELQKPGVVWQKPASEVEDIRSLLERVCRYIRPRRLLVVVDQFEEFVILQDPVHRQRFERVLTSIRDQPIREITFLLVFRSDYIALIEELPVPPLVQGTNWKDVPAFTERAARDFIRGSGLSLEDEFLHDVLREAAEIEQTKGLIRPVTINLCGLVLGRFAGGPPRGFRPGGLIHGFLRESIFLPAVRDIAPRLILCLITSYKTKRPRTIEELAQETSFDPAAVRGCLRVLGQSDRAVVRPLDAGQQTWEISHDFLVPLLDSIVARWRVSFWRRFRSWVPWIAVITLVLGVPVASNWWKDPVLKLRELGWVVHKTDKGMKLTFEGVPPRESLKALQRTSIALDVQLDRMDESISEWRVLKNLSSLTFILSSSVRDVSPLRDLTSLSKLDLQYAALTDVLPLKNLKNLSELNLSSTKVSDISPLKDLKNLSNLQLSYTEVSDISPLKDLKNLSELDLSDPSNVRQEFLFPYFGLSVRGEVKDISALRELKNLSKLNLSGTKVSDVSPLRDLKNLYKLDLRDTEVRDVSPLRDLKSKRPDLTVEQPGLLGRGNDAVI